MDIDLEDALLMEGMFNCHTYVTETGTVLNETATHHVDAAAAYQSNRVRL